MAIQGTTRQTEVSRTKSQRDVRSFGDQTLELLRSVPGIGFIYLVLVGVTVAFTGLFDVTLVIGLAYAALVAARKPDLPFRKRQSQGELDHADTIPGTRKGRRARGIFFLGNRTDDGAEIWAANEDMRTHAFVLGSTGAGKTEGLISLFYNTLVQASGACYLDGKADVKLWAQIWSMCRALGREDDLRVINYMTGNADTKLKRATKLSNTTNPFTTGNAESNTQLLVDLMDAAGSGGDMWKGRAISWLSSLMPPLHELRDAGYLQLHVGLIRDSAPPLRYFELMEHPGISERSRDGMRAFLSTVPGFNPAKKPEQQSSSFLDQYGFQTMQFTRILGSLADTYGHIYGTAAGEVVYRDVVLNRRILLVLLPALEKSRPELANLGKINVAALKAMMGTELGGQLEGTKRDLLDARSTNAPMPFVAIFDEFGYFMPDGAALMWAQARGLGFSLVAAGQDLQAFFRTSREETMAIFSNCNIKIVGKLEDPDATFDMIRKTAGEAFVAEHEGYDLKPDGPSSFKARMGARLAKTERITLQDLRNQVEGDVHILIKADIIRGRTFYSAPKLAKEYRINHFVKVLPPDAEAIRARRLDVRGVIDSLRVAPFNEIDAVDDRLSPLSQLITSTGALKYTKTKQGAERGILLMMRLSNAGAVDVAGAADRETSAGGLAHKPQASEAASAPLAHAPDASPADTAMDALGDMLGVADTAPTPAIEVAESTLAAAETFDGGRLEATNVFESTLASVGLVQEMTAIAEAALPLLDALFDMSSLADGAASAETPAGTGTEEGSLDRSETQVKLTRIAVGLGATAAAAEEAAQSIVQAAVDGTEYPAPPKPVATPDKQETMEGVMSDLEALMGSGSPGA
ncbi:MAG: IcmO-like type IV secretion system protein [Burkholderiaceae bacterium]|nr:MAG: IcmO-like type IV secretion system protein [Burkholderiaceae bacterium]